MQTLAALQNGQLSSITRLQLAENLTELPNEIFDLADTLEVLDLSNNCLSSLPDDFGRLVQLKILFLSNNQFETLPKVLADCPKLEMIGFKANKIHTVDEDALPVQTRWLILTDNQIEALPESMGQLHRLQKLALAGNCLSALPASMANCKKLELVRLSANKLTHIPDWLLQLPRLAWLAFDGNRLSCTDKITLSVPEMLKVKMTDIDLAEQLGEGASGVIYKGKWNHQPISLHGTPDLIAVKLFKGEVTSDGYPADELACCLQAGEHPNLIRVISQINEQEHLGLVMELIPPSFFNLGLPPSLQTCTRDTFASGAQFSVSQIAKILQQMAATMTHLHQQAVSHGDLYAHNTMINGDAEMLFGDFGASSDLSVLPQLQREAMQAIEVRAFGCLLEDLLLANEKHLSDEAALSGKQALLSVLLQMRDSCLHDEFALRPRFFEISEQLALAVSKQVSEALL
ncbi:leucine-rich repeat-containing serine/threonine-protein kinase [Shewanella eurypsychrophilus]|uniref:Leucine-rich repeat-containing serine/threonine-protein kinase n=1 Tax=Shewanella eurypsychrophilus TaxID=2593656 RepID=A0ABX6V3I2_9GAMM|nr:MULTISPECIES: leucine-rich repeat-containing protein kinase family protein [Shewanella]QFU21898.1 protein kinase [Shewanella sp. YLB-09]QPG57187.1 leucine-rich repeat-containing serine/threonine-protein kinase [Shewanella eurypsychrophilus]